MTQSLGNMVACEALREGLHVAQYYMFDAAVPTEAIDGTLRAETSADAPFTKYVRAEWRGYTNACWASNWHRNFAGDPNDARGGMAGNYNYQSQTPNGWPLGRQESRDGVRVDTWLHSDIKNVAFYYVQKVFEKIRKGE